VEGGRTFLRGGTKSGKFHSGEAGEEYTRDDTRNVICNLGGNDSPELWKEVTYDDIDTEREGKKEKPIAVGTLILGVRFTKC